LTSELLGYWNYTILLLEQVEGKHGEYSRLGIAVIQDGELENRNLIFGPDKVREIDLV
jgi:hypothetical protein